MPTSHDSIQVYGSGCPTCKTLHDRTTQAVQELGIPTEVEYVTDIQRLIGLGVMQSPVLAVDGKLLVVGFVPDVETIKRLLQAELSK